VKRRSYRTYHFFFDFARFFYHDFCGGARLFTKALDVVIFTKNDKDFFSKDDKSFK
jgi:hypothetical protein